MNATQPIPSAIPSAIAPPCPPADPAQAAPMAGDGAAPSGSKSRDFAAALTAAKAADHQVKRAAARDSPGAILPPTGNPPPLAATALVVPAGAGATPAASARADGLLIEPPVAGQGSAAAANPVNLSSAATLASASTLAGAAALAGAATPASAWTLAGAMPGKGMRSVPPAAAVTADAATGGQPLNTDAASLAAAIVAAPVNGAAGTNVASTGTVSTGTASVGARSVGLAVDGTVGPRPIGAGFAAMATGKPAANASPFPLSASSSRSGAAPAGTDDSRENVLTAAATAAASAATSNATATAIDSATVASADTVANAAAQALSASDTPSLDSIAAPVDAANSKPDLRADAMTGPGANAAIAGAVATPPAAASTVLAQAAQLAHAALAALIPMGAEKHGGEMQGAVAVAGPVAFGGSTDAAAAAAASSPFASIDAPAAVADKLNAPLGSPAFPQELAERVAYVVANNLNGATLQVNPPQLGPIELRVTVEAGHAQVMLSAHNSATCDALQAGSGKLKEMLAPGFAQVSVDVSQRSFQERSAYSQTYQWTPAPDTDAQAPISAVHSSPAVAAAARGLDAYA